MNYGDPYREGGPYDDVAQNIRADQREPPDPDPLFPCDGCGDTHRVSTFKESGQLPESPGEAALCAECLEYPTGTASLEERRERNHDINRWTTTND